MLDEVLKSNEATGKTVEAAEAAAGIGASGGNCGGECGAPAAASAAQAASAGETALAEITPPEQFQNFYAFPPEQPQSGLAASTGGLNKKTFSRSASVGNQVKLRQFSTNKNNNFVISMNFDILLDNSNRIY